MHISLLRTTMSINVGENRKLTLNCHLVRSKHAKRVNNPKHAVQHITKKCKDIGAIIQQKNNEWCKEQNAEWMLLSSMWLFIKKSSSWYFNLFSGRHWFKGAVRGYDVSSRTFRNILLTAFDTKSFGDCLHIYVCVPKDKSQQETWPKLTSHSRQTTDIWIKRLKEIEGDGGQGCTCYL